MRTKLAQSIRLSQFLVSRLPLGLLTTFVSVSFLSTSCAVSLRTFQNTAAPTTLTSSSSSSTLITFTCVGHESETDHKALGDPNVSSALWGQSQTYPYYICTAAQLASIGVNSADWSRHYQLRDDINLTDYTEAADGTQWIPIGSSGSPFTGTFDGYSKTISNFNYNDNAYDYLGIFGYLKGGVAEVKNIALTSVNITGRNYVGGLVGWIQQGRVINISVSGAVNGTANVGGVVGYMDVGLIGDSQSSAATIGTSLYVGGIVGFNDKGYVMNSYNSGIVQGTNSIGGISGGDNTSFLINVYNSGDIYWFRKSCGWHRWTYKLGLHAKLLFNGKYSGE